MKRRFWCAAGLLCILVLLISPVFAAEENDPFQERLPPIPVNMNPQWTETEVEIQSGENTLRGTLTRPSNVDEKIPMAILFHGLNTDRRWCDDIAWCLADHGIASVRFDFGGNGQSDGRQEDMTISSEVQDAKAILSYVEGFSITDPDNIFMIGKSMGAVAATRAAADRPGEVKALCLWYPGFGVSAATRFGYFLGEFYAPWDPPEVLEVAGYRYGKAFLEEAAGYEFSDAMERYDDPVLILHGDRDYIAPIYFSLEAQEHFSDCKLYAVPGGGHGFLMMQELIALQDMITFLGENIS